MLFPHCVFPKQLLHSQFGIFNEPQMLIFQTPEETRVAGAWVWTHDLWTMRQMCYQSPCRQFNLYKIQLKENTYNIFWHKHIPWLNTFFFVVQWSLLVDSALRITKMHSLQSTLNYNTALSIWKICPCCVELACAC